MAWKPRYQEDVVEDTTPIAVWNGKLPPGNHTSRRRVYPPTEASNEVSVEVAAGIKQGNAIFQGLPHSSSSQEGLPGMQVAGHPTQTSRRRSHIRAQPSSFKLVGPNPRKPIWSKKAQAAAGAAVDEFIAWVVENLIAAADETGCSEISLRHLQLVCHTDPALRRMVFRD